MNEWLDGWMDGWMGGWMDGWMDRETFWACVNLKVGLERRSHLYFLIHNLATMNLCVSPEYIFIEKSCLCQFL